MTESLSTSPSPSVSKPKPISLKASWDQPLLAAPTLSYTQWCATVDKLNWTPHLKNIENWYAAHGVTYLAAVLIEATTLGGYRFHPNHRVVIGWKQDHILPLWWRPRTNRHSYLIWRSIRPQLTLLRNWIEDAGVLTKSIEWNLQMLADHLVSVNFDELLQIADRLFYMQEFFHAPKIAAPNIDRYADVSRFPSVQTVWFDDHIRIHFGTTHAMCQLQYSVELEGSPIITQLQAGYMAMTGTPLPAIAVPLSTINEIRYFFADGDDTERILQHTLKTICHRDYAPQPNQPHQRWLRLTKDKDRAHPYANGHIILIPRKSIDLSADQTWRLHPNELAPIVQFRAKGTSRLTHAYSSNNQLWYLCQSGYWIEDSDVELAES